MQSTNMGQVLTSESLSAEALLEQLRWRYATKKFDPQRKIPAEDWRVLEEALVLSPSSFGLQPWKFIVITDPQLRERLRTASWNQAQIVDASHLVVFAIKKDLNAADVERYVQRIAEVRGLHVDALSQYKQMMLGFIAQAANGLDINAWSARQVYLALGVFLTTAAAMGIDTCPMEGIEPDAYDKILGLNQQGYHPLAVATAGYRAADDSFAKLPKVRFKPEEVVVHVS